MFFLFHHQHQAFQIGPFGMEDVDGMVGGLRQLINNSYIAFGFDGSGSDYALERGLVDGLRTTEGEQ